MTNINFTILCLTIITIVDFIFSNLPGASIALWVMYGAYKSTTE